MATKAGETGQLRLSDNARLVLERRYLAKDERGHLIETPEELFRRVARSIAEPEATHGASKAQVAQWEERFFALLTSLRFLPNSPTLGNAGRPLQQLAACFVIPVGDSMEGIFGAIGDMAMIHKSGGGTGFSFSRLRPAGDVVRSTAGLASGPVSFMKVFDAATEAIKQGGTRRGANMAILSIDHPDIEEFIRVKADMVTLTNFNISVAVNERFMTAVERDEEYPLINPRTGEPVAKRRAREVFRRIVENAWLNGDPGLVFIDRVNRDNPTPQLGPIEATNPCGEQPLLPYESCNLGSLDLSKFVQLKAGVKARSDGEDTGLEVDWEALAETIPLAVRFLDDVIDANRYPVPQIEEMTRKTRKIGLGIMGWADLLFQLRIPYGSEEALQLGERMMAFISEHADEASEALAAERAVFPSWNESVYAKKGQERKFRNSTRTTVAPTGTLSIIADCSGGIEPVFALAFTRQHFLDPKRPQKVTQLTELNKHFERAAREGSFHSKKLMDALATGGRLADQPNVPEWARRVFVTAHDVAPQWHVRMQAAFQRHTNNAVSKTINFAQDATPEDVEKAYLLAYREGCKGITIYRDRSREMQVLSHATVRGPEQAEAVAAERSLGLLTLPPRRPGEPYRRRLPDERESVTHKFNVGGQEGYITVGLYDDGSPGEVFVTISKEGSTIRGLMDSVAVLTSLSLQYGVPVDDLARKFSGVRFEPHGFTNNPDLPQATSIVDYLFRWLAHRFGEQAASGGRRHSRRRRGSLRRNRSAGSTLQRDIATGVTCPECGALLVFAEGCLVCRSCGYEKCG